MAISNYNTNPNLNTTISGLNIAENCPPGNINDAIRQMMADIRTFYAAQASSGGELPEKITLTGAVTGTGNFNGATNVTIATTMGSGTATAATKLATARNIAISGGATGTATAFDGSANITIPITALNMGQASAGTLAIARGGTGRTDGKVTALATARNIALTGAVTGSASFDGSANASIATTLVASAWAKPQAATGVGQWYLFTGTGNASLPSGGTWAYYVQSMNENGNLYNKAAGVAAGGTNVMSVSGSNTKSGFAWRIA